MRVRIVQDCTVWIADQYRLETIKAGREFDGPLADYLMNSGAPVEEITEGPAVDLDGDGVPDGTAQQVLDWVGDDKGRAAQALGAEVAKGDKARSTLVAALTKLTD